MRPLIKGLAILAFGALALSPVLAYLDLDPVPGDFAFSLSDTHIHVPVFYSLCASGGLALFTFFMKR
jgi:hypothetical protein